MHFWVQIFQIVQFNCSVFEQPVKDDWVMAMMVVVTMMNIERTWREQVEEEGKKRKRQRTSVNIVAVLQCVQPTSNSHDDNDDDNHRNHPTFWKLNVQDHGVEDGQPKQDAHQFKLHGWFQGVR